MGKPEHHCDPKDPPYVAYTKPFVARTTTTTLPPVSDYIVYPNSELSCPDLTYKSESFTGANCPRPSGSGYEVLLNNASSGCQGGNFTVVDDQCSRGAIVQYKCCTDDYRNILVSGVDMILCMAPSSELRNVYGNIINAYITPECAPTTTTTPPPCADGITKPVTVLFGTYTITDKLEVFHTPSSDNPDSGLLRDHWIYKHG